MVVSANDSQVLPAPRERRGMPYSSISLRICGERTPYRAPICAVESSCRWQRFSNVGLLSRSFKVGRAAPQRRLRVRLMTKRQARRRQRRQAVSWFSSSYSCGAYEARNPQAPCMAILRRTMSSSASCSAKARSSALRCSLSNRASRSSLVSVRRGFRS